ncbi:hypothetical protein BJV74DRAFT_844641 [Russula compacta]|nr:hypothetical protein BJV74DRAFT_844641 [Russula compacta]
MPNRSAVSRALMVLVTLKLELLRQPVNAASIGSSIGSTQAKQTRVLPRMPRPALEEGYNTLGVPFHGPNDSTSSAQEQRGEAQRVVAGQIHGALFGDAYVLRLVGHTSAHQFQSAGPRKHAEPYGEAHETVWAHQGAGHPLGHLSPHSGKTSDGVRWRPRARGACIE